MLPCCVPFNSHLHVCNKHKKESNRWCPCSPTIWTWLVRKITSLQWYSLFCENEIDKESAFLKTVDQVYVYLRATKYTLHYLAEYYLKVLLTYYYEEGKVYISIVYCAFDFQCFYSVYIVYTTLYKEVSPCCSCCW